MRGLRRSDILYVMELKAGEIVLGKIIDPERQKNKKICIVVDENKNILFICIFSCVSQKGKNGKKKIFPIPLGATKFFITTKIHLTKNPRGGRRKSNFKIKFI